MTEPRAPCPHDGGYGGKTSGSSPRRPKVEGGGPPGGPPTFERPPGTAAVLVKGDRAPGALAPFERPRDVAVPLERNEQCRARMCTTLR